MGPGYQINTSTGGNVTWEAQPLHRKLQCEEPNFNGEDHPGGGASVQFWLQRSPIFHTDASPDTSAARATRARLAPPDS